MAVVLSPHYSTRSFSSLPINLDGFNASLEDLDIDSLTPENFSSNVTLIDLKSRVLTLTAQISLIIVGKCIIKHLGTFFKHEPDINRLKKLIRKLSKIGFCIKFSDSFKELEYIKNVYKRFSRAKEKIDEINHDFSKLHKDFRSHTEVLIYDNDSDSD